MNEWNLKNTMEYEDGCGAPIYYEEDIETLRKRLIEDIVNMSDFYEELQGWDFPDKIITVINKRFGVDKE